MEIIFSHGYYYYIIIIIIILVITFMQGIYNYIPETNHVFRVHCVAAVLYFTSALSAVCVQCPIWLFFYSYLISPFPDMLLRYCLSDSEMVPVAPIITGITLLSHSTCD